MRVHQESHTAEWHDFYSLHISVFLISTGYWFLA